MSVATPPPSAQEVATWHGITVEGSRVTEIKLNNNNLTGTIPSELGGLSSLQHLNLINNSLTGTIPSELGGLSSLTKLRLHNNDLTGTIPTELSELANLQILGLSANALTGTIPSQLGNLSSLTGLFLHQNELTGTIPPELGNLTSLRNLWLKDNRLTGGIPPSVEALSANKQLENPPYVEVQIEDVDAVVEYDENSTRDHSIRVDIGENFGDINDNITSYSASGLPDGLTIDPITGVISGTPTRSAAANFADSNKIVTITASDDAGGSVTDKFNITVSFFNSSARLYFTNASDYKTLKDINNRYWNFTNIRVTDRYHGSVPLDINVNRMLNGVTAENGCIPDLQR